MVYTVNGVKFDGFRTDVLLEAKGNYGQFVNPATDNLHSWWTGEQPLIK